MIKLTDLVRRTKGRGPIIGIVFFVLSACADIPGDDIRFLDRIAPVGTAADQLASALPSRGFVRIDGALSFAILPENAGLIEGADAALGLVDLEGTPVGALSCYEKPYGYAVASGVRRICWTEDANGAITWRQAGWIGAML